MSFERLMRLTKKCPGYVVSGLRNASVGILTVTQKSFGSQYYITRALFGTRSLFAMTDRFLIRPVTASVRRNEDQQTQSPSPSQVPKDNIFIRKMEARLAWGGGIQTP